MPTSRSSQAASLRAAAINRARTSGATGTAQNGSRLLCRRGIAACSSCSA